MLTLPAPQVLKLEQEQGHSAGTTVKRICNCEAVLCSGSEAGSYVRLTASCITQLRAQGTAWTCSESKEEEEEEEEEVMFVIRTWISGTGVPRS